MEAVEVQWNMVFVVHGLGVLSETFRKPLGNRSSCVDVFRLGEKSGCPDLVAFFKQFIWEVSFWVRRQLGISSALSSLSASSTKAGKGSLAGIYLFSVLPLGVLFRPAVSLAAYAAVREAPGYFDSLGTEINLQVVLGQPGEPEYHALLAKTGDHKQNMFRMLVIGHDHVDNFVDAPSLIKGSIHIVNWNQLG